MSIDAVALVRIPAAALESGGVPRSRMNPLIDATLVYTGSPFGSEPDEHGIALRHLLGDTLDLHDDPRGVLIIPDVAEVQSTRYQAAVDEVAEVAHKLLHSLETHAPPRNREEEAAKARARAAQRFGA